MWRLIFLGLIIGLAYYFVKRSFQQSVGATQADNAKENVESMVKCDSCGVHLPKSEAFLVNQKFYCCQEHISAK